MQRNEVRERMLVDGPRALSDAELLAVFGAGAASGRTLAELAWLTVRELRAEGLGESRALALAAAFELGRRGAWAPPKRGERCLDPGRVAELMRPLAHAEVEEFHVVLLDVRGKLLRAARVAQGSVSQCPVSPRDILRLAVREGAHGVIFVHNHPSGEAAPPSPEDVELTIRLCAAAELVGCCPGTTSSSRRVGTTPSSRPGAGAGEVTLRAAPGDRCRSPEATMPFVNVADVDVKYHQVEVPEACPMCGSPLATADGYRRAVRELDLASANYYGTFGRPDGDSGFTFDPAASEEHPSDAVWIVFGYECVRCGELLATGTVSVN